MNADPGTIADLARSDDGARPAVTAIDTPALSYDQLAALLPTTQRALRSRGVDAGDRVAIVLPNGPLAATAFVAVASSAVAAPLNPAITEAEFAFYLDDLDAAAMVVAEGSPESAMRAAESLSVPILETQVVTGAEAGRFSLPSAGVGTFRPPTPDDAALVLHTSGTTGRPKIVELSHRNLIASASNVARTLRLNPADVCLNVMPLFHIHGIVAALLATLRSGASVVATPGYAAPRFADWLIDERATWYTAVPTIHQSIAERLHRDGPRTFPDLRFIRSSSSSMAPTTLHDLEDLFGVPVVEAYGMTEAAHQIASNQLPPGPRRAGTVGVAAGPAVRIVDEAGETVPSGAIGEVAISGTNVITGYAGGRGSESFIDNGWFRTGDLGTLDDAGTLTLVGRIKETINRGGETIAPRGIDEAMLEVAGVRQAVAFAVPDDALGEEVAAAIVLEEGADLDSVSVQRALEPVLSFARMPKLILFVDEIPKGPTGKLKRIDLAELLGVDTVHGQTREDPAPGDDDTITTLRELWSEVLERDDLGIDDRFLDVGGDSLAATALLVRAEETFDVEIPVMTFYEAATIRLQAAVIADLSAS